MAFRYDLIRHGRCRDMIRKSSYKNIGKFYDVEDEIRTQTSCLSSQVANELINREKSTRYRYNTVQTFNILRR